MLSHPTGDFPANRRLIPAKVGCNLTVSKTLIKQIGYRYSVMADKTLSASYLRFAFSGMIIEYQTPRHAIMMPRFHRFSAAINHLASLFIAFSSINKFQSSFYKWVNTRENRRLKICSDALIGARIKTIFDDEHGLYGAKRIAASLNDDMDFGPIYHKKVARIMKSMGLKGFTKRRRCITTRRKPGHRVMPDLVGRKFTADRPNHVYVGDITYLPCKGGKNMYLATVIDVYSRKLVGHALADHMRVSLVIEALSHASKVRGNLTRAIFHSDHGSVYTSQAFGDHCAQLGVRQSMGAVGTSADNALAESFNATLKREVLRDRKVFDNPITCRQEVFRWCMRYNTRRRHS